MSRRTDPIYISAAGGPAITSKLTELLPSSNKSCVIGDLGMGENISANRVKNDTSPNNGGSDLIIAAS